MNSEEIKEFLRQYNIKNGWGITDSDLIETLRESKQLESKVFGSCRWWNNLICIVQIEDKIIGYEWASATGDKSIWDLGWVFYWDSLEEYVPIEVTKIEYKPKQK